MIKFFNFVIILFLICPLNTLANNLDLNEFMAPKVGHKNTYSCVFPCARIEISGEEGSSKNELRLKKVLKFSEELVKNNPKMPEFIANDRILHLLGDRIVDGDIQTGNILIKSPIEKTNKSWMIRGVFGNVTRQKDISKLKKQKVSWTCNIVDVGKERIFLQERNIVTVKCISNYSPKEVIWWRYASGIGLIENITGHMDNSKLIKMKIMEIIKAK